jgi:superfamily II DNA or RNA helicase
MDYLKLVLDWFTSLHIKNINEEKLKRQLSIISTWFKFNAIGAISAVTGFGKTMVAIIAIYRLNLKYPEATTIVVVPSTKLYKDWLEHLETFNLKNVTVYVINTYTSIFLKTKIKHKCTLLIVDELHNALSEHGIQFNQTISGTEYQMFFGMSATLNDDEEELLNKAGISIIDTVSLSEASRFNYISQYEIYNYGIELSTEEQEKYTKFNDIHNSNYAKFRYFPDSNRNWQLAQACGVANETTVPVGNEWRNGRDWRKWYSEVMGWDGSDDHPWHPKAISKYANQWNWAMRERKNFLYKSQAKIDVAVNIINFLNVPTITFAETTEFADELVAKLGDKALAYHTNLKAGYEKEQKIEFRKQLTPAKNLAKRYNGKIGTYIEDKGYSITYYKEKKIAAAKLKRLALSKFESKEISVLCTAKALDEGFNVEGIECAIICSASSQRRQAVQRQGRALRFIEGKTAKIINIYIKNTQDETWLKKRQKGDTNIRWIENINEIITL